MSSKIYTRTGDNGKTSLLGGTKVPKSHFRIESYGTVDELNAFIGLLQDQVTQKDCKEFLRSVQDRLFTLGALLASEGKETLKLKIPQLAKSDVQDLENAIDQMNSELPEMKAFILPGGHPTVSTAHICRCICRRAERCCVRLMEDHETLDPWVIPYLNRLSDYLFVLARWLCRQLNCTEIVWVPRT